MELKAEREQLLKTKNMYSSLITCLCNEFGEAYKEGCYVRAENDQLHAELAKIATEFGYEIPPEYKWKQRTSKQAVESIEDFFLRMLTAAGSENIRAGDLPPEFPSLTPYSDLQPHMGAAAFDFEHNMADSDSSWSRCGMQTAAPNPAVGEDLTARVIFQVQPSGVSTLLTVCSKAAHCVVPGRNEPNLMRPAQDQKRDQCNSLPQKNPMRIPMQPPPAKAAIMDTPQPNFPRLVTYGHMELGAGPQLESSLLNNTSSSSGSVCKAPSHHANLIDSCKSLPVTPPPAESSGQSNSAVEESPHLTPAIEAAGTLSESGPSIPSSSSIQGSTTLIVRNIPARYTKEMLLREWPVDGTFDFLYLPFCFRRVRSAGFLFINFTSSTAASAFHSQWHGQSLRHQVSPAKLCIVAAEVQGLEKNVWHLINCRIARIKNPKYLPSVFDGLQEVPFSEYVEQLQQSYQSSSGVQNVQLQ